MHVRGPGLVTLALCVALTAGACAQSAPTAAPPPAASAAPPAPVRAASSSVAAVPPPPPAPAGLPVPVAVVVENAPDARPQAGLDAADIVWEISAEGFITRFFAIFSSHTAAKIGPVRSTRLYFDQLDRAYGLPLAHAGGNVDALAWIGTWRLQNLDAIYGSGGYFWRSTDRRAPHNLYTSTDMLEKAVHAAGYTAPKVLSPATGAPAPDALPTASVALNYLTDPPIYTYVAGWQWDATAWVRTVNGAVQVMADGHQVRAGTVIVLAVPDAPDPDPYTTGALQMLWSVGGKAWVLRGGARAEGTWAMGADGLPGVSAGGQPLGAGVGPYWYEVVPSTWQVSFT